MVEQALLLMSGGRWGVLIGMQLTFFILGFVLDSPGAPNLHYQIKKIEH